MHELDLFCVNMKFLPFSFLFLLSCKLGSGYRSFNEPQKAWPCSTTDDCQDFILKSKCIQNVCKCSPNELLSSDASKCLPRVTEYGSPCEDNIQCSDLLSSGGVCDGKTCICKNGYHYLKGSCWKNSALHEKCLKDEQCFASYENVGLKCEQNKCICRENYRERLSSGCRRKRKTGESCNLSDDCTDGSKCESMTCSMPDTSQQILSAYSNKTTFGEEKEKKNGKCFAGMFELNGDCVRELGMPCNNDKECNHIRKAICLDGSTCACEPVKYVAGENNRECLQVTRGMVEDVSKSSCQKDPQCGVFGEDSVCKNKRCACKEGTYFETENKFCWRIRSLGESCSDTKDCHPSETQADCTEKNSKKVCLCKKGYHAKGLKCVPDAIAVGDPCEVDNECLFPNTFCNSTTKVCTCKKNHYPKDGKCERGVGTLCTTNADCSHLKNTECKINDLPVKRCLCLENYTNSDDYRYCLPIADFKNECSESFQCKFRLGESGECKQNRCECREEAHYWNGTCYKSKYPGQSCTKLPDCNPGNDTDSVICLKGYCSCNYGYFELREAGICVKTNSATTIKFYSMPLMALVFFLSARR